MIIHQLPVGPLEANCYIVGDEKTKEAIIIDPGHPDPVILEKLKNEGWNLQGIWLTHGHFDHISGIALLKQEFNIPVWVHRIENEYLEDPDLNLSANFLSQPIHYTGDYFLEEGMTVSVGSYTFQALHIPGHSAGSICYYEPNEKILFSGDVLFRGSIGRSDLPKGDFVSLMTNIKEKLLVLPEETKVYSGHGPSTTIGYEKNYNSYLSDDWG
ncbi:MAG: MBL fold metallo-hydrolase [Epulopiscium sp.]|nr:MBL fold metallo-hydrolase [Candidatus Epulonipiscium sp.]